jgi:peptidase M23-like protein
MAGAYFFIILSQVIIPLYAVLSLWRRKDWNNREWVFAVSLGAAYLLFLFVVTPWGFVPYPLRYVWPLAFLAAAVRSFVRLRREQEQGQEPGKRPSIPRLSVFWHGLGALLFGIQAVNGVRGYFYPGPALDLAFPLREGVYVVGHGGSQRIVNYHNVSASQRYALDITALNALGLRSLGFEPKALDRYAIFGHTLHSPCDGTVRSVVNDRPDHIPPDHDPEQPAGNHVEIEADGIRIYLAHLQRGSIRVKQGDRVKRGDPLGKVGNSGNTSEPHLHIHAVRGGQSLFEGEGIPLTFNGRFLVRNDLVFGR